jgi:hypothetical protein
LWRFSEHVPVHRQQTYLNAQSLICHFSRYKITRKTKPYSFEERLKKLAEVWKGWVNNYRLANIHAKLKAVDEWLRNEERIHEMPLKFNTLSNKPPPVLYLA